ncbi:MAG: hypothetical protein R3C52_02860 [Hyphomonadaceae bacterium]
MSEVVVQIQDDGSDPARLADALNAFAKWSEETGQDSRSDEAPDIMMMTEHSGDFIRRKLIFQSRAHAARFMVFWRQERHRARPV